MNFNLGTQAGELKQVVDASHPPVFRVIPVATGTVVLAAGSVVTRDVNRALVLWDGTAGAPVGVLPNDVDPGRETNARVLVHGTVVKSAILINGTALTDVQIIDLESIGIWAG